MSLSLNLNEEGKQAPVKWALGVGYFDLYILGKIMMFSRERINKNSQQTEQKMINE